MAPQTLVNWLARHLACIDETGSASRFELQYDCVDGQYPIERVAVSDGDERLTAEELAALIHGAATNDADSRRGPMHRYSVLAYYGSNESHTSVTAFTLQGRLGDSSPPATEPANEQGLIAQLMRHNEQTQLTMFKVVQSTLGQLASDLENERRQRVSLEARREEVLQLKESLLTESDARQLAREESERRNARIDSLLSGIMQILPGVLSVGVEALARLAAPKEESLVKSLSDDQVRSLVPILNKRQIELLSEAVKKKDPIND
jgi:hypothetical protein